MAARSEAAGRSTRLSAARTCRWSATARRRRARSVRRRWLVLGVARCLCGQAPAHLAAVAVCTC